MFLWKIIKIGEASPFVCHKLEYLDMVYDNILFKKIQDMPQFSILVKSQDVIIIYNY